jgi:hypothetical protein
MTKLPLLLATILASATAQASQCNISGTLFGATWSSGMDLDGDGNAARAGTLRARGSVFSYADVVVDTKLIGPCMGGVELEPSGHAVWSTLDGRDVIFAVIDSSRHLCTGAAESVQLTITGGRGAYAGATGTASARFPDDTVLVFSPVGFPRMVYTHGAEFTVRVR